MPDLLTRPLTYVFLVSTMLAIGLSVTGPEIVGACRNRRMMGRVLLGNLVLVPLLGLVLAHVFRFSQDVTVAILLLASAPGGLMAIQFTNKVKGSLAFAAAAAFVLTAAAIIVTPLVAKLLLPLETEVNLPYLRVIGIVIVFLLLPLLAGFGIRRLCGRVVGILAKAMLLISNVSFVATIVATAASKRQAMGELGGSVVIALLILILGSMAIGWWLGGPENGNRRVMAITTSMRNAGLCLLVAVASFPQGKVDVVVIAFMGLMVPPNMLFTLYYVIREKRRARTAAKGA